MFTFDTMLPEFFTTACPPDNLPKQKGPIYGEFKLPISYLPENQRFLLSETVQSDLELVQAQNPESKSMYEHLFQPTHPFAKDMIEEWKKSYTTNVEYLGETQTVLMDVVKFDECKINHSSLMETWKDTKDNAFFLEKYCYVEWDMLQSFNRSSGFLQILAVGNILSPVMSLVLPLLFLIFPFIILKIRGLPITFSIYLDVLKDIAKNHFLGKALLNLNSITFDKAIYLIITVALYFYQIYQNVLLCSRFYTHIHKINSSLYEMREYAINATRNMELFIKLHEKKDKYKEFCSVTRTHSNKLRELHGELSGVNPFESDLEMLSKIAQVGYLLKCYYELHANREYEEALRYSFGFEGYLDNLRGVYTHLSSGNMNAAQFKKKAHCVIKNQYYPSYYDKTHIKNDCSLKKNMIITGPNASGKTTYLKTSTINIIFSQQVGCGFYQSCVLNPYTHIHSYLNIPDTSERDSLFQAESRRCKEIIDSIRDYPEEKGFRHYGIFDELYSGTNPIEAAKSAKAFLKYLSKFKHVDFILTTHYTSICKTLAKTNAICNYKMDVSIKESGKMEYTYKMAKGISKIRGAVRILEEMDYPKEIVDAIR